MAKERWAEVLLVVDVKCDESRDELYLEGRGLTYLTFTDQLVFQGYWPWSSQDFHDVMEFDSKGMISNIRPCPHMLTFEQLQAMRVVAQEALAEATTDAERRVMARIDELLAATDGAALSSAQLGCTNLPGVRTGEQDPWAEH
jgi:hypothetical protein